MAKIIITKNLEEEVNKKFKGESIEIFNLMNSLKEFPSKSKPVGQAAGMVIKELKYEGYRFYFIADGYKIKMLKKEDLEELLIKFVRMSDKKSQQKVIDEIKVILRSLGQEGF